jgi:hypothetical protein
MRRIASLVFLALTFTVPRAGDGAGEPGNLLGERVAVTLLQWSTEPGGSKTQTGSAGEELEVGGRGQLYATAGEDLCSRSIGTSPPELGAESAHVWSVGVRVLAATTQRIELEVDWARRDRTPAGDSERGGRRVITLREGEAHMLDFLEAAPSGEGQRPCVINALYEIQADIVEDPALAQTRLRYDVWFVHETPDGRATAHRREATAGQGESVTLEFPELRWPVRTVLADGSRAEVVGELSAGMLGRLRPDGSVDVSFSAGRWLGVAREGQPRRGGVGDGGRRLVNVQAGETIELVLPAPGGSHLEYREQGQVRSGVIPGEGAGPGGVRVDDASVRIDFGPFFEGHTMSLVVTATVE